uniref:RING-type E3 ubiquitin transferase n=1 Tax=Tabanus bromius TaxID=304241 RepID=A0A0K8TRY1_TABBR
MSRHEGVSCDSCLKSNFSGRRYKCLICYDYDLCADCYDEGATSTRHSADHPMQCILTRADIDLYFGGEMLNSEQPQSFTCPYCKKMGFSDSALLEHVSSEHTDTGLEVVCPVCAGLPGGEPNLVTDDFAGHLTLEHRTGPRDLISFLDEPSAIRHGGVRRIPGRALPGPRSRRSNMHFSSSSGLSALSPSGRESVDPIAELLSQLSGVRRGAPQPTQLQQLQMQIQLERQQVSATRQNLERLPRRQAHPTVSSSNSNAPMQEVITSGSGACNNSGAGEGSITSSSLPLAVTASGLSSGQGNGTGDTQSQFLLARFMTPSLDENELAQLERDRADRSQYVQALLLSTMASLQLEDERDSEKRGESQETNSDNVNSETNNDSSDENTTQNDKTRKSENGSVDGGGGGQANQQQHPQHTLEDEFVEQQQQQQQQQQHYNSAMNKKKIPSAVAGKSNSRGRQQVASGGTHQQGQQSKPPREVKSSTMSSKEVPDSR